VGASARMVLTEAAAQTWGVPVGGMLRAEMPRSTTVARGKKLSYGELVAKAAALPVPDEKSVKVKEPKDYKATWNAHLGCRQSEDCQRSGALRHRHETSRDALRRVRKMPGIRVGKIVSANLDQIKALPG